MPTLTIRDIEEELRNRLRLRAARHGRSMEAEVREILREALTAPDDNKLGTRIHQRFASIGGANLEQPTRTERPRAAKLT